MKARFRPRIIALLTLNAVVIVALGCIVALNISGDTEPARPAWRSIPAEQSAACREVRENLPAAAAAGRFDWNSCR
jgi:hypothetical protein